MITTLIVLIPTAFFLGFYLRVVLHTLIDILNILQKIKIHQEKTVQPATGTPVTPPPMEFIEPESLVEYNAREEIERIARLSQNGQQMR